MVQRGGKPKLCAHRSASQMQKSSGWGLRMREKEGENRRCDAGEEVKASRAHRRLLPQQSLDIIDNKHLWPGSDPRDLRSVEARF